MTNLYWRTLGRFLLRIARQEKVLTVVQTVLYSEYEASHHVLF